MSHTTLSLASLSTISCDCHSPFRFFVPGHRPVRPYNRFRLQLTVLRALLLPVLIPSISHYPANSSPARPSRKSSCPRLSARRRRNRYSFLILLSRFFRIHQFFFLFPPPNRFHATRQFFFKAQTARSLIIRSVPKN